MAVEKNIYGESLEAPIQKKVLLFSGGLDSWVTAHLWNPDILLYCSINHRYQNKELQVISQLLPYLPTSIPFVEDSRVDLNQDERQDAIIPLRNLYFLMIASRYGDVVGVGVLYGEVNGDKSHTFAKAAENIFYTCYKESYWSEGRRIKIEYPICDYTKAEAVQEYLKQGFSAQAILNTVSCYEGREKHCGLCSNCLKRYIAFQLNGIGEEFENDPKTSPYVQEFKNRMGSYDTRRQQEIKEVLF